MPKVVDHHQRRRELLQATAAVIAAEGIQAATVRRIAAEVGCTTGLVTHYFPEKEELVIGALRQVNSVSAERMLARARQASGLEALRAVLMECLPLTVVARQEWHVWLSFWGVAWTSPALSAEHRDHYEVWRGSIHNALRDAAQVGQTRPGLDLREATDRLVALVDGLGLQAMYEPRRLTPARVMAIIDAQLADFAAGPSS